MKETLDFVDMGIEKPNMKDFMGNVLAVDDDIVVCVGHGRNAGASLRKGRVVGFTKEFVRIVLSGKDTDPRLTDPRKVVKYK